MNNSENNVNKKKRQTLGGLLARIFFDIVVVIAIQTVIRWIEAVFGANIFNQPMWQSISSALSLAIADRIFTAYEAWREQEWDERARMLSRVSKKSLDYLLKVELPSWVSPGLFILIALILLVILPFAIPTVLGISYYSDWPTISVDAHHPEVQLVQRYCNALKTQTYADFYRATPIRMGQQAGDSLTAYVNEAKNIDTKLGVTTACSIQREQRWQTPIGTASVQYRFFMKVTRSHGSSFVQQFRFYETDNLIVLDSWEGPLQE